MKSGARLILAAAFAALTAGAALAATSERDGEKLCEDLAITQPNYKAVRVEKDATRSTDAVLWFNLRLSTTDGASTKLKCAVDRKADKAQLFAG